MTNFSTNQVMQFYVLDGTAVIQTPITGEYFKVKFTDADGNITLSDKIENVMYGKLTKAAALTIPYTVANITLNAAVNSGAPVVGQNYTIRVSYPEVGGVGVEGWTTKVANVTASSEINTAVLLYDALAEALNEAFGVDAVLVATADGAGDGISITQKDLTKYYKRGVRPLIVSDFKVSAPAITLESGEEVQPFADTSFKVVESEAAPIGGGYKVADMEYFAMGERGDQYRYVDYVNAIDTEYKVNPKSSYDVLVVHYAYKGANQNSHKSEKDIIIASTDAAKLLTLAQSIAKASDVTFTTVASKGAAETVLATE